MENPDLDIRYILPDRIDEYTDGQVTDNGYDYITKDVMGIWLEAEEASANVDKIISLIESEKILENDLSNVAEIYVSEEECAELGQCRKVYPV